MEEATPLQQFYIAVEPFVKERSQKAFKAEELFDSCLRAALVKSYEFNTIVTYLSDSDPAFFYLPSLRGICEDVIWLKYLSTCPSIDRETVLRAYIQIDTMGKLACQEQYFKSNRPYQQVLHPDSLPISLEDAQEELGVIGQQLRWKFNEDGSVRLPSVSYMAKKHGLGELYEYVYAITSDMVHFNPGVLLRMGWGNNLDKITYSTKHFNKYYLEFLQVYGTYLFCLLIDELSVYLKVDAHVKQQVSVAKDYLNSLLRWPEIVTFEEMNIKPLSAVITLLTKSLMHLNDEIK